MPKLSRAQMRGVDRRAIEELGVPGVVLMENVAVRVAEAVHTEVEHNRIGGGVVIVCGPGNNGGDGFAIARQLVIRGLTPRVLHARPIDALKGDAGTNARICRAMGLDLQPATPEAVRAPCGVLLDCLFGTGLAGPPREPEAELIAAMNAATAVLKLAVDVPSGVDADTGGPLGDDAFRADRTAVLGAAKLGQPSRFCGATFTVPIGVDVAALAGR